MICALNGKKCLLSCETPCDGPDWGGKYDPITVAEALRFTYHHSISDTPLVFPEEKLLLRAAKTLDFCVPSYWRALAIIQSLAFLALATWEAYSR